MIWVGMVHDFLRLRKDRAFVRLRMPGVRAVMAACLNHIDAASNLFRHPPGWNFMDWSANLADPPDPSGSINWLLVMALRWWMELEAEAGEPELASLARRRLEAVSDAVDRAFWNPTRGAWSEDLAQQQFTEHSQALAILCSAGTADAERKARCQKASTLLSDPQPGVAVATIYFTHYVLEALLEMNDQAGFERRLDFWRALPATGLKTLPEQPEPTRSDCHGWGAHVLYHLARRAPQT
jgi:hypothetical protein